MKSYGRGEKLTIVAWDCGKGKLLVLEGGGGGGESLLNLGCLISLSSLIPSYCSCSSRGRRRDDEGCVRNISTSGDSTRGTGSSLRSCSWTTASDCTSSSPGPAIPKVNARRSTILKVSLQRSSISKMYHNQKTTTKINNNSPMHRLRNGSILILEFLQYRTSTRIKE
jgi:hypothetical protein